MDTLLANIVSPVLAQTKTPKLYLLIYLIFLMAVPCAGYGRMPHEVQPVGFVPELGSPGAGQYGENVYHPIQETSH